MTDDQPLAAYDPDSTPGAGFTPDQTWAHPSDAPTTPTPQGEVLLDADGQRQEIAPRDDGRPVQLNIGNDNKEA